MVIHFFPSLLGFVILALGLTCTACYYMTILPCTLVRSGKKEVLFFYCSGLGSDLMDFVLSLLYISLVFVLLTRDRWLPGEGMMVYFTVHHHLLGRGAGLHQTHLR